MSSRKSSTMSFMIQITERWKTLDKTGFWTNLELNKSWPCFRPGTSTCSSRRSWGCWTPTTTSPTTPSTVLPPWKIETLCCRSERFNPETNLIKFHILFFSAHGYRQAASLISSTTGGNDEMHLEYHNYQISTEKTIQIISFPYFVTSFIFVTCIFQCPPSFSSSEEGIHTRNILSYWWAIFCVEIRKYIRFIMYPTSLVARFQQLIVRNLMYWSWAFYEK